MPLLVPEKPERVLRYVNSRPKDSGAARVFEPRVRPSRTPVKTFSRDQNNHPGEYGILALMHPFDSARRDFFRALFAGAAGLSLSRSTFAQAPPATPIKASKLSDYVTMVSGDGGNVAVVTSGDGLMMIDGGYQERAADLLKTVKENVDAHSVNLLFNTHWHLDHVGCNETLGKSGARIMAHENVKKRLSVRTTMESMNRTFEPLKPEGLPTENFAKNGRLTYGKEKIDYTHIALAHTDGDSYLFFPGPNILHTGDLMFNGFYPVIDYSTGGWIGGMVAASEALLKVGDAKTRIIPGHGPLASKDDLKATRDMLATVHARMEKLVKEGKSVDEVASLAPLKDLDEKWGKGPMKPDNFTRVAFTSILRHTQKA
jgi:cyclase